MLSSSHVDRVCGYRLETTAKLIAVGLLESGRTGCRSGRMRPFPTLRSDRSEPEGSIKGSIPTARWSSCKLSRNKAPVCGAFAEPSDGLEPSTPPYHGGFELRRGADERRLTPRFPSNSASSSGRRALPRRALGIPERPRTCPQNLAPDESMARSSVARWLGSGYVAAWSARDTSCGCRSFARSSATPSPTHAASNTKRPMS
jgi:hypothetical protein